MTRVRRHLAILGLLPLLLVSMASCDSDGGSPTSEGGRLSVVAAFYPIQAAVEAVGGDRVEVTNLTAPGVEPHDLELTPDAIEAIQSAGVVFYLGEGFQPAVEAAVDGAQGVTVDLLADAPTLPPPPGEEGESLTVDPHIWLAPGLYAEMTQRIAEVLSEASPADAATFRANAADYVKVLDGLDQEFRSGLRVCQRRTIVTGHAAFGYLADAYGLTQVPISGLSPDAEPSARRIAELKDLVERQGITTVFTEELVSPKVAETLASEAGVDTAVLFTLEGLTPDEIASGADYASLMRENLITLKHALGCT